MPHDGTYSDGNGGSGSLLPVGEHACILKSFERTVGTAYESDEQEEQYKWGFESTPRGWKDGDGEPGIITQWTGRGYGNEKAKLTHLVDSVFDRHLTPAEWRKLEPELMVGIVGYVQVLRHKKRDGTVTVKFGGFRNAGGKVPVPMPEQFVEENESVAPRTPTPKAVTDAEMDSEAHRLDGGFDDPFADDAPQNKRANGTGSESAF